MQPHPTFNTQRRNQGFTLIELMITIAIAAILLAFSLPSFQSTMTSSQLTTKANDLITALNTARGAAIKSNTAATLCRSTAGTACDGATWADGWLAWVDLNRNGALNAPAEVLNLSVAANSLVIAGNANVATQVRFRSDGTLNGLPGTIRVCKTTTAVPVNENARDIVISGVGRARVERPNPAIAVAGTCPAP